MVGTKTQEYLKEHSEPIVQELTERELLVKILATLESLEEMAKREENWKQNKRNATPLVNGLYGKESKYYDKKSTHL